MNTLLIPTYGNVEIDGKVINSKNNKNLKNIKRRIGLVFQFAEYQLFEETVIKDIEFGPKIFNVENYHDEAKKACELVGLSPDFFEKSPFRLSGGEMRKVAIAGILASNPDVLILDEPTVGLDPFTRRELLKLLKDINNQGKTVIVVTHDMDVVGETAKRIIVLKDGTIACDSSKDELFKNDDIMEKFSLDYPTSVKILKEIKNKFNIELNELQYTIEDAYTELSKVLGNE